MLGLRGHGAAAVVVATLDRHEVLTLLAPVFQREQPCLQVGLGVGSPTATTAGDSPVIYHNPSVRRVGWAQYLGRMGKKKITSRAVAGITAATVSAAIVCGDEKEHPHLEVSPPTIAATPPTPLRAIDLLIADMLGLFRSRRPPEGPTRLLHRSPADADASPQTIKMSTANTIGRIGCERRQ
jgi:hypothetical protein